VRDEKAVRDAVGAFRPEVVINASGVVMQRHEASAAIPSIEVNALFPHRLAALCRDVNARLVQYSTDCVFSGRKGAYSEAETPDPVDLYGRSKLLGEPGGAACLTLRTSMIGPELWRKTGLLEWFLAQKGSAPGYRRAIFSGLTTLEHARIIEQILAPASWKPGLYHLSAAAISKFDLLLMIKRRFQLDIEVIADDRVVVDRSLDSRRFREAFGYRPPAWEEMIDELASTMRDRKR
jgi:dTDP-4-dehydrorhamnose reductase